MSLRTRFILTFGLGGLFFLLIITQLVFSRMESAMVTQLQQQFQNDTKHRITSLNNIFTDKTKRFQSMANLPMFKSMRFHELTLNKAAYKNDVRQMELFILDLITKNPELSQVRYINKKGFEVFMLIEQELNEIYLT